MNFKSVATSFLIAITAMLAGCAILNPGVPSSPPGIPVTAAPTRSATIASSPSAVPATPAAIQAAPKAYKNKTFGVCLQYPADWQGPEVYENKDSFVFDIGTDKVYPYGTSLENRLYTKSDAYHISLTFTKRPNDVSIEKYKVDQPWLTQYLTLLSLKDGESKSDQRAKVTRVRSIAAGEYSGIEVIATTSGAAQTDFFYQREAFLINSQYNTFRVSASPANVRVANATSRQDEFARVDEANLPTFRKVVDSIATCAP